MLEACACVPLGTLVRRRAPFTPTMDSHSRVAVPSIVWWIRCAGYQGVDYPSYDSPSAVEARADAVLGQLRRSIEQGEVDAERARTGQAAGRSGGKHGRHDGAVATRLDGGNVLGAMVDGASASIGLGRGCAAKRAPDCIPC